MSAAANEKICSTGGHFPRTSATHRNGLANPEYISHKIHHIEGRFSIAFSCIRAYVQCWRELPLSPSLSHIEDLLSLFLSCRSNTREQYFPPNHPYATALPMLMCITFASLLHDFGEEFSLSLLLSLSRPFCFLSWYLCARRTRPRYVGDFYSTTPRTEQRAVPKTGGIEPRADWPSKTV